MNGPPNSNMRRYGNAAINNAVNGRVNQAINARNNLVNSAKNVSPENVKRALNYIGVVDEKLARIIGILNSNLVMKPKTFRFNSN
jgi:hypothetical protein